MEEPSKTRPLQTRSRPCDDTGVCTKQRAEQAGAGEGRASGHAHAMRCSLGLDPVFCTKTALQYGCCCG